MTIKSDDIKGRAKTYEAIVRSKEIPEPGIPESFNVLTKEIMGLGFDMFMQDSHGRKFAINAYDDDDNDIDEEYTKYDSMESLTGGKDLSADGFSAVSEQEIAIDFEGQE